MKNLLYFVSRNQVRERAGFKNQEYNILSLGGSNKWIVLAHYHQMVEILTMKCFEMWNLLLFGKIPKPIVVAGWAFERQWQSANSISWKDICQNFAIFLHSVQVLERHLQSSKSNFLILFVHLNKHNGWQMNKPLSFANFSHHLYLLFIRPRVDHALPMSVTIY